MNAGSSPVDPAHLAAALHVANACHAWSHSGGLYEHTFSSDFQIPGHVLGDLGLLETPSGEEYPGRLRWLVEDPSAFEAVIRHNLATGPSRDEVFVALAFCFIDLTDEQFDLLVAEGVFETEKDVQPNLWGKLIASPVLTTEGRRLEQLWLHWWDRR